MKRKIILLFFTAISSVMASCDLHEEEFALIQERMDAVKYKMEMINKQMANIQALIKAVQEQDYITSVEPVYGDDHTLLGYMIYFLNGDPITIFNGETGKDGKNGADGKDGKDGKAGKDGQDGKDAAAPSISIKQDTDGNWYWFVNGEWLVDDYNNKFPVYGKDAIIPKLQINGDNWYISYDNGITWTFLASANVTFDSLIRNIYQYEDHFRIYLSDGQSIQIPRLTSPIISFSGETQNIPVTTRSVYSTNYSIAPSGTHHVGYYAVGGMTVSVFNQSSSGGAISVGIPEGFSSGTLYLFFSMNSMVVTKTLTFKKL